MPHSEDDEADDSVAWWGRPQDDPKLLAMQDEQRRQFRRARPPVNCWIDGVRTLVLYQNGIMRAFVERDRSLISFRDEHGNTTSTAIYLGSENPYDLAEAYLGIGRVNEIRDESDDADEPISSAPRDAEERAVAEFTARHSGADEILYYLRSAASRAKLDPGHAGFRDLVLPRLQEAINAAALADHRAALSHINAAINELEKLELGLFLEAALPDCRRAAIATERHLAAR